MKQTERVLRRAIDRQLSGEDAPLFDSRGAPAIAPTPEAAARIRAQLIKVADHLAAAHRFVPILEDLQQKKLITTSLIIAGRHYAVLAFVADGPSVGVANYGDRIESDPHNRSLTTDERLRARELLKLARYAAFGVRNRNFEWEIDQALRDSVEPVILGDAAAWAPGEIGKYLSGYKARDMARAAGVTEIVAVLRRLRSFFMIGDDL